MPSIPFSQHEGVSTPEDTPMTLTTDLSVLCVQVCRALQADTFWSTKVDLIRYIVHDDFTALLYRAGQHCPQADKILVDVQPYLDLADQSCEYVLRFRWFEGKVLLGTVGVSAYWSPHQEKVVYIGSRMTDAQTLMSALLPWQSLNLS